MYRLVVIPALVVFAAACGNTAPPTQPESAQFHAPSFNQGGVPNDASELNPSAVGAFEVNVKVTSTLIPGDTGPVGTEFPNCYTLQDDGVWVDPGFPVLGTWEGDIRGATARYTAFAELDIGDDVVLRIDQSGTVTPFRGRDSRKLKAYSVFSISGTVLAEFLSRGVAVDSCSP